MTLDELAALVWLTWRNEQRTIFPHYGSDNWEAVSLYVKNEWKVRIRLYLQTGEFMGDAAIIKMVVDLYADHVGDLS